MRVLSMSAQKKEASREDHPDSEVEDDPAEFGSGEYPHTWGMQCTAGREQLQQAWNEG